MTGEGGALGSPTAPRVTSADVAHAAGVSRGTVFNVLHGRDDVVRAETRERVLRAVDALGYVPSAAARQLRRGTSSLVLIISPEHEPAGAEGTALLDDLARELAARGITMVWQLGIPGAPHPNLELTPSVVLTVPSDTDPAFASVARGFAVPVLPVFPGRDEHVASAGLTQAEHVARLGVEDVVYVGPRDPRLAGMSALREKALLEAGTRLALRVRSVQPLPADRAVWAESVGAWSRERPGRLAVCAFNDEVALEVLAGAHDAGLVVPDDVAVIGVDNSPAAASAIPGLTSVSADMGRFAQRMADSVADLIAGRSVPLPRLPAAFRVHARASTVGPRCSDR